MLYVKLILVIFFGIIFLYPVGQYLWAWSKYNFSEEYVRAGLGYTTSLSGFETLPALDFKKSPIDSNGTTTTTIDSAMCTHGLYLGSEDKYINCIDRCGHEDYEYRYINPNEKLVIHKRELYGAYCLPKAATQCNLNTSLAVIGLDGYKCISKFPTLLGGASGNEIIGCDSGQLIDGLTNETYTHMIPTNLIINDINERLPNGLYRFRCVNPADHIDVDVTIGSRFESEIDVCKILDENGKRGDDGTCVCDHYINRGNNAICTQCTSGWEVVNNQHGSKYGFTLGRNCVDPMTVDERMSTVVPFPCGQTTLDMNKRCERALVNVTNTYTAQTLENIL